MKMEARQKQNSFTSKMQKIVNHRAFTFTVIALILFNALIVGIETYPRIYADHKWLFYRIDLVLLWIFTIEIAMRFLASNPKSAFFRSSWNWFDFLIVAAGHIFAGAQFVTVLRILRVLRVLRAISVVPSLRRLVDALVMTIPALGNILILMSIFFYIFAVIGTMLFQHVSPEYFGNLQLSLLTLFQVVTLESWASGVMRPIFAEVPWSWLYFVSFVLIGTFIIFNLFIGVIVNNVEKAELTDNEEDGEADGLKQEISALRKDVAELKSLLKQSK
ncbi:BH1501 [Halalkalibacterium halodurans C-125]|uniref:BH1501 protein n=2 Tax=Halalkalibacterium halodurans TaxID=86665 RepID=Q9KCR8_HALH5|nr:Chain A, BH1501 protein [Halalkalibacterium halodurans C-125]6VWX_D Chain D, BH1501 protein [Halalkalibacterium halodurans C-125]6VWX_E Chain E, BH1501 protein [Halalkalibacterium halodurans C-125]6VWX_F Chain F, BH1501 protein [Halalkalibacterium halodurans C-125]6VX3_A Chain A, BH1501 protein [Halalkalibacterium halodurans C-125]6VX3_B Chain B, BH1501 protein [Halalkalibacterium halodurans C-125]6VX3_C Chain C, BH1501 protein [Halalkalibacterium halodurans C-125]6VX3_D Chain D, BH1501 p